MRSGFFCLLLASAALFSSCSKLPDKRPDDLRISVSESGGMNPEGHSITLAKDSCTGEYYSMNETHHVRFMLSPAEWDSLYAVFKNAKFDLIGEHEEMIYDRGGSSLSLSFGGHDFHKSDGGMSVVNKRWKYNYRMCIDAVYAIINPKVEAQKSDVRIVLDSSLFSYGAELYVQTGRSEYYFGPENLHAGDTLKMRLLAGDYRLLVRIDCPAESGINHHDIEADEHFQVKTRTPCLFVLFRHDNTVRLTLPPSAFYIDETESTH